ncbi:hypothetical protein BDR26DRAFT_852204 [Obelidium mucronatum]|nr:hypothetical protein BDR26DRAFT_852204 [Obelidium mucronatum]
MAAAANMSIKDKYILSLEEHCTVSDSLRVAETTAHALEKDVQLLQQEVETLKALVAEAFNRKRTAPSSNLHSSHASKKHNATSAPAGATGAITTPTGSATPVSTTHPIMTVPGSSTSSSAAPTTATPSGSPPKFNIPQSNSTVPKFMSPYTPSDLAKSLDFTLAPPPNMFPSGSPNTQGVRAWTDILRAKYPTFKRTSPSMSKSAKEFMGTKGNRLYVASLTGDRISRPTHAVPEEHITEFVAFMENLYLRNGMFGDASCHDL